MRRGTQNINGSGMRALRTLLAILTVVFAAAALLYLIGPLWLPNRDFFQELPFVSNSVVKVGILLCCCLYARGDLRGRSGLVVIVLAAHLISVAAMAILYFTVDTSRIVNPGLGGSRSVGQVLLGAMGLDGVILLGLGAVYWWARRELPRPIPAPPSRAYAAYLTPAEQWLRRVLLGLGVLFVAGAIAYEAGPISGIAPDFFRELPFVTNSVVKVSTLAMVCLWVTRALRLRMSLVGTIIAVHFLSAAAQIFYLLAEPQALNHSATLFGRTYSMTQILWSSIVLDGVIGAILMALYLAAWRARLACQFLQPVEYRTLIALSEVMTEGSEKLVTPEESARNVDRALAAMQTERRVLFRVALILLHYWPVTALWPPLPEIATEQRSDYLKRRFKRRAGQPWVLAPIRTVLQTFTRMAHQLSVLGYYSDPRTFESVGYTPFTQRVRYHGLHVPPTDALELRVDQPWDITSDVIDTEVLVIGSGAGGATVAYGLAEQGKSVLLAERGKYVEPLAFSENELDQLGRLYDGGLLQVASDHRFGVLQGSCVGGSTTVNNAICFAPPPAAVARWNQPAGQNAGIDVADLQASTNWVHQFLDVHPLGTSIPPFAFHRAADLLAAGIGAAGPACRLTDPQPFEANIRHGSCACYGCGKCNIGCPYGKKLSMLNETLPRAQKQFGRRVRILADCEVRSIRTLSGKPSQVQDVRARLADGRWVTIKAEAYVLAAGALASSHLLLRSGVGRGLPVGKGLAFNMVAPVFAEFPAEMNSYDGIQMGHYVNDMAGDRFLIETWWSLPVGLGLTMGGWFDEHFQNMRQAGKMTAYGVVVGTDRESSVYVNPLNSDMGFHHRPTALDMERITEGIGRLAGVLFQAGANRVIINTWDDGSITSPVRIPAVMEKARDPRFLSLASAHPQGGNAMSRTAGRGVVDDQCRVHGYANLFVTDASMFPTSLQVNPQMTVMALARYAVPRIAAALA